MSINKKLLEFQKLNISVKKKGKNPHFKSSYATLNDVMAEIKEPLSKLNILIVQIPQKEGLVTKLIDTEDESLIESFLPYVEASTAQKLGSNNTYNRRYALVTMLGLEDEDDDGNRASNKTTKSGKGLKLTREEIESVTPFGPGSEDED